MDRAGVAGDRLIILVESGDGGPLRGRVAGAAELRPRRRRAVVVRVINRKTRVRVGVVGDIGVSPEGGALGDYAFLIAGLRFDGANAAAAAAPSGLAEPIALAIDIQSR